MRARTSPFNEPSDGTDLLEQQARQHHYHNIALYVAEGNQPALDLYTQQHYVVTRRTFLYQRPHLRMVKTLESSDTH
jgi:ribosomal protein S18 acetylase RimI-like enzyme